MAAEDKIQPVAQAAAKMPSARVIRVGSAVAEIRTGARKGMKTDSAGRL
jgi:hypothetical protein